MILCAWLPLSLFAPLPSFLHLQKDAQACTCVHRLHNDDENRCMCQGPGMSQLSIRNWLLRRATANSEIQGKGMQRWRRGKWRTLMIHGRCPTSRFPRKQTNEKTNDVKRGSTPLVALARANHSVERCCMYTPSLTVTSAVRSTA